MLIWRLDDRVETSAGRVAAGFAGDGPPLVLAHGWPWSSYAWHRVIPRLAEANRVFWYDMPGFGRSDLAPSRPPSIGVQGEVLCEMLDHWRLDAPLVVAHDFGGAVGLRAHLLHDRDYAGLVLMNVVALRPWGSAFFAHVGRHIDAFTGLPAQIHEGVVRAYLDSAMAIPVSQADRDALAEPWLGPGGQDAFYAQFALADERFTAEIEPLYGMIRCPVAILWGEADPWIPLDRGRALAELVGVTLDPLPRLGHLPQLEAPTRVSERLLAALP